MQISRVVEILRDGKSKGSGYLLTPRHVLTARHVARPELTATRRSVHPLCAPGHHVDQPRPQPSPACIGWKSDQHDLAILELPATSVPAATPMIPFGDIPQEGPPRQIIGSGFPAAAGTDQRTIIGTATWVGNEPKRFDIDVASALPSDPAEWGGFSGAALFSDNLLVGVVRTYDPSWQGKLEATPATFLLDDPSFQAYCRTVGLPPPIRLDAGPMDTTIRLDFDQDAETTGLLRFSPRNPHVPFIGREPELQSLQHFLFADTGPPFSWWLMTGGGGTGKTRLARQLCLQARQQGWRAGFLPRDAQLTVESLDAWNPRTPVLLIADYVMPRLDTLRRLIDRLEPRHGLPRLRLLLLEREAGTLFTSQFLGSDTGTKAKIVRSRHPPEPLALQGLSDDQLWALVESRPWRPDNADLPPLPSDFFQQLERLDSGRTPRIAIEHRPLVAMMLADTLSDRGNRAGLGGLEDVLQEIVERDRNLFWPKQLGTENAKVGKTDADVAIAFATMADGLREPELEAIEAAYGHPIDDETLEACANAIGRPANPDIALGRLEPDLIGEFFALETLQYPKSRPAKRAHPWMPQTAWRARGSAMFDFVTRAKQTFPQHPAISQIDITVPGVKESWWLAALAIVRRPNNLTAGLNDAQAWLLPHAKSDTGAALAFADLVLTVTLLKPGSVDPPELLALLDGLAAVHQIHGTELPLNSLLACSMHNTGVTLGKLNRREAAIDVYDDLLGRFANAPEPPLREFVARALNNKGVMLNALNRREAAIDVYDDLLGRFATAPEPPLRELAAQALFGKGFTLGELNRSEAAIDVYDDLLGRFANAPEPPLREFVARALNNKGVMLSALNRKEAAIAAYDDLFDRFATAPEPPLQKAVGQALANKIAILEELNRLDPATTIADLLLIKPATTIADLLLNRFVTSVVLPLRE